MTPSKHLAYITGIAIGDGNISSPNKRTYRLRISCDSKYPKLIEKIIKSLIIVFPKNKVTLIPKKKTCFDISVYNNNINNLFGWKHEKGKKVNQKIIIPKWINTEIDYVKFFIKGLIESDGSVYFDRKYLMINYVSYNKEIIDYLKKEITKLNFNPTISKTKEKNYPKYTLRIAQNSKEFIKFFNIKKE